MRLQPCETLRRAAEGCRVVLVCATDGEAEPVLAALRAPEQHVLATKTVYVGEIAGERRAEEAPEADRRGAVPRLPVRLLLGVSGCDKANAAHLLTCLLQAMWPGPELVIQFGIAGAFPSTGREPGAGMGDIVVATQEAYSDTGSSSPQGWLPAAELGLPVARIDGKELAGVFPLDAGLALAAVTAIQAADRSSPDRRDAPSVVLLGPCVTASRVTGLRAEAEVLAARWGALAESMEGAAAAHVCALYEAPFVEVRAISNLVEDRDRASWQVEQAIASAGKAALAVAAGVDRLPLDQRR